MLNTNRTISSSSSSSSVGSVRFSAFCVSYAALSCESITFGVWILLWSVLPLLLFRPIPFCSLLLNHTALRLPIPVRSRFHIGIVAHSITYTIHCRLHLSEWVTSVRLVSPPSIVLRMRFSNCWSSEILFPRMMHDPCEYDLLPHAHHILFYSGWQWPVSTTVNVFTSELEIDTAFDSCGRHFPRFSVQQEGGQVGYFGSVIGIKTFVKMWLSLRECIPDGYRIGRGRRKSESVSARDSSAFSFPNIITLSVQWHVHGWLEALVNISLLWFYLHREPLSYDYQEIPWVGYSEIKTFSW